MTSLHNVLLIALYLVLALAALTDVWKLRIPNIFPAAIILLFPIWMYSCGWNAQLWQNALVFVGTFLGGLFLFSRGWLGGGDVKLMAAIALWFDFKGAAALYLWMGIGGALLLGVMVFLIAASRLAAPFLMAWRSRPARCLRSSGATSILSPRPGTSTRPA